MISIYKTDVTATSDINKLKPVLDEILGNERWNFDLEDCDKVFRIVTEDKYKILKAVKVLENFGYSCSELE